MSEHDDQGRTEPTPYGQEPQGQERYGQQPYGQQQLRPAAPVRTAAVRPAVRPAALRAAPVRATAVRAAPVRAAPVRRSPTPVRPAVRPGLRPVRSDGGTGQAGARRSSPPSSGSSSGRSVCSCRWPPSSAGPSRPGCPATPTPRSPASASSAARSAASSSRSASLALVWTVVMIWGSIWALTGRSRVLLLVGGSIALAFTLIGFLGNLTDGGNSGAGGVAVQPAVLPGLAGDRRPALACARRPSSSPPTARAAGR